jgi:hypothetical protein
MLTPAVAAGPDAALIVECNRLLIIYAAVEARMMMMGSRHEPARGHPADRRAGLSG